MYKHYFSYTTFFRKIFYNLISMLILSSFSCYGGFSCFNKSSFRNYILLKICYL